MSNFTKKNKYSNPRNNVIPLGDKDGVNLSYLLPDGEQYWPGTLKVYIDGVLKTPGVDFNENGTTGFTFILAPNNGNGMNAPVCQSEDLLIEYYKKPNCL